MPEEAEAAKARASIIEQGVANASSLSESKKKEAENVADFIVESFVKKF